MWSVDTCGVYLRAQTGGRVVFAPPRSPSETPRKVAAPPGVFPSRRAQRIQLDPRKGMAHILKKALSTDNTESVELDGLRKENERLRLLVRGGRRESLRVFGGESRRGGCARCESRIPELG